MNDTDLNLRLIGIGPPGRFLEQSGLKVEAHDIMTHDHFKAFLATLDNAIGIVPLDDSQFSRCKSAIKFFDLSLAGIPAVCSKVPPYSDVLIDGETGRLCDNRTNDWYQTVKELALMTKERNALARQAREYCLRNFPLRHAADCWFAAVQNTHPGQGQSGSRLATKYRQMVLLQQLLQPARYLAALRILKNEGWRGLGAKVKQYL